MVGPKLSETNGVVLVMALANVLEKNLAADEIHSRTTQISTRLLQVSRSIDAPNFSAIHVSDLKQLFVEYDSRFFDGQLQSALGSSPLRFRLSRRLTSTAGTTTRRPQAGVRQKSSKRISQATAFEFEICMSATILFQSFTDPSATTTANGVLCHHRMDALQRVFEHELIHLAEMLVWSDSRCAGPRFQSIARGMFGHREHTHRLVTSREHALIKFGFRVGDQVAFEYEGQNYRGRINRLTRRATILVEDNAGGRYTDGKRYRKFYVPLQKLRAVRIAS
jgi:hypothetical protein